MIFKSAAGSSPERILPFPDGKDLLISTGNDQVEGSTSVTLYRVDRPLTLPRKSANYPAAQPALCGMTRAKLSCAAARSTMSRTFGNTVCPMAA